MRGKIQLSLPYAEAPPVCDKLATEQSNLQSLNAFILALCESVCQCSWQRGRPSCCLYAVGKLISYVSPKQKIWVPSNHHNLAGKSTENDVCLSLHLLYQDQEKNKSPSLTTPFRWGTNPIKIRVEHQRPRSSRRCKLRTCPRHFGEAFICSLCLCPMQRFAHRTKPELGAQPNPGV